MLRSDVSHLDTDGAVEYLKKIPLFKAGWEKELLLTKSKFYIDILIIYQPNCPLAPRFMRNLIAGCKG